MNMKVAFQTISWGMWINKIEEVLNIIHKAGYQGVEFSQRPDALGVVDFAQLFELLQERNLVLVSIVGGTLKERIEFCDEPKVEYLYVEHWDLVNIPFAVERGFTVAFHPRMAAPRGHLVDILKLSEMYPDLKFIIDTAHMTILGDEPVRVIQTLAEEDKLIAVHLKDWTPDFGRSKYRFARGFTTLGGGYVNLDGVVKELKARHFKGWIVAELDNARVSPTASVYQNAEWLTHYRLMRASALTESFSEGEQTEKIEPYLGKLPCEAEARFREILMYAIKDSPETFYDCVAKAFSQVLNCKLITVSTYHSSEFAEFITLRACYPQHLPILPNVSNFRNTLSGIAIHRQAIYTHFDLNEAAPGEKYGYPDRKFSDPNLQKVLSLNSMITLPIFNSGNQNAVRLLVNLFPEQAGGIYSEEEWYRLGRAVTQAADSMIDGHCMSAFIKVNRLAGQCDRALEFLAGLVNLIKKVIRCEGVAIFCVNERGDRLELPDRLTTGTIWRKEHEKFYRKGEGITGSVWERSEIIISNPREDLEDHVGKSTEIVANQSQNVNIWVPFLDPKGNVIAVIRCRNKIMPPHIIAPSMFSSDDASLIDAIAQAAGPHIHILQGDEHRAKSLDKLMHEIRTPLVAIRGVADFLRRDDELRGSWKYDYLGDIWSWGELMQRLMLNANWFSYTLDSLKVQAKRTYLRAGIIAPAVKQVRMLLEEKDFPASNIRYSQFEQVPALYVDPNQFQQVMFNLLSNSIKHCYNDPYSFQVEINGEQSRGEYIIQFRDWGPGISHKMRERVFEERFRTKEAIRRNITGQGLGLWVVRQIVEAHDGRVEITQFRHPLEFSIYLPKYLSHMPPKSAY